jgi:hypothetical protein
LRPGANLPPGPSPELPARGQLPPLVASAFRIEIDPPEFQIPRFPGSHVPLVARTVSGLVRLVYERGVLDGFTLGFEAGGIVGAAVGSIVTLVAYTVVLHVVHWLGQRKAS